MKQNKLIVYIALSGSVLTIILSAITGSEIALIVSVLGLSFSIATWKYGNAIANLLKIPLKVDRNQTEYEVSKNNDVIVKNDDGRYLASTFIQCKINTSASTQTESERNAYALQFERLLSSIKPTTKFCLMCTTPDLSEYVDKIKTKRSKDEVLKNRLESEPHASNEVAKVERSIAMWNNLLDNISKGQKPIELVFYAQVTSEALGKEEAIIKARSNELKTLISSALNVETQTLCGQDMLKCFEWERFLPPDKESLYDEVF